MIIIILKFNFQVPYNTNNIFARNIFFQGMSSLMYSLLYGLSNLYEPLIVFLKKTDLEINNLTFLRLLMIIDKLFIVC